MLYIVSTPIGNLKDMSHRAVEILKSVDMIAAEDTRHSKILTNEYGIDTPLTSFFEHNELKKVDSLLNVLREGKDVALISDAGTPGICDPGYRLITMAQLEGIPMSVIPGPVALIAALTLSGLPAHSFVFEGFLPVKGAARRKKLESLKKEDRTIIVYESPHRILKSLIDIQDVFHDAPIVVVREITKKFEEVLKDKPSLLVEHFTKHNPKGEFVLLWNLTAGV